MERERINARQREAFVALYGGAQLLDKYYADFAALSRRVPNGYRDYKLTMSVLEKLLGKLLDTIPADQLQTIQRQMSMSEIRVATRDYTGKRHDDWLLSRDDISTLVNAAAERCMTCENETGAGCGLSRLIDELPVDVVNTLYIGCKE